MWCRNQWERAVAIGLVIVGLGALVLGWAGVSRVGLIAQQVPYVISGGVFALFVLAISAVLWLSADLHDEWCKLDKIEEALKRVGLCADDAATSGVSRWGDDQERTRARREVASPEDGQAKIGAGGGNARSAS